MADNYALELNEGELARYRLMAEIARKSEAELWAAAGIGTGARIADIGCGPGAVTAVLGEIVGPSGSVFGVDGDPGTVEVARDNLRIAGLANCEVSVGSADNSGLPASDFDVVMIRHVLAHNGGREQSIVEHGTSLARPGGFVYVVDVDLTMGRLYPSDPDSEDMLDRYLQFLRSRGNNPQIGLALQSLQREAGLEPISFTGQLNIVPMLPRMGGPAWAARDAMLASGAASHADVERWGAALAKADRLPSPRLFFASMMIAIGRKAA